MEIQKERFNEAVLQLNECSPQKQSLLYHNLCTLKKGDEYLFSSKEDITALVSFLNSMEN